MNSMPVISVIVPVYKVEPYLDQCVASIVNQTYQDLEIILVDDGSPDNCPAMCDAWAEKDSRIKTIHTANGGSAKARNTGLALSSGNYIGFVDSDDFILPEMYESLLHIMEDSKCDIVECGYYTVHSSQMPERDIEHAPVRTLNTEQALFENINDQICRQLVWNKLYAQKVLEDIRFVEGKFIDDEFFTYRALGNAKRIAVSSTRLYCYRQQNGSAMHQTYSLKRLDSLDAKVLRLAYIREHFPQLLSLAQCDLHFSCIYAMQMCLQHLSPTELAIARKKVKSITNAIKPLHQQRNMSVKQSIWLYLSQLSFEGTCRLRNMLKIGM